MRPRTIWIAAIAASSLVLVTLRGMVLDAGGPPAQPPSTATPPPGAARTVTIYSGATDDVRSELADLRADVSRLGGAPKAKEPELSPEEQRAFDERRASQTHAVLAKAFAADARDPSWSPQVERSLREAFTAAQVPGGRLEEVACGSTLCRYSVVFDSLAQREDGIDAITALARWDSRMFGGPTPGDPQRYVVYVSRDAESFPPLEN